MVRREEGALDEAAEEGEVRRADVFADRVEEVERREDVRRRALRGRSGGVVVRARRVDPGSAARLGAVAKGTKVESASGLGGESGPESLLPGNARAKEIIKRVELSATGLEAVGPGIAAAEGGSKAPASQARAPERGLPKAQRSGSRAKPSRGTVGTKTRTRGGLPRQDA